MEPTQAKDGVVRHTVQGIVLHFGFILLPVEEIERMEHDANGDYKYMHHPQLTPQDKGYFNGLADYASKKATQLRNAYMQNPSFQGTPGTAYPEKRCSASDLQNRKGENERG